MRKVFWSGLTLTVFVAMGIYWAADFCQRHPDSPLAFYAIEASQCGQGVDPLLRFDPPWVGQDNGHCPTSAGVETERLYGIGVGAEPCSERATPLAQVPEIVPAEVIDLSTLTLTSSRLCGEGIALTVGPLAVDSQEDAYRVMPPCLEDVKDLPATMPYAVDFDNSGCPACCQSGKCTSVGQPMTLGSVASESEEQESRTGPPASVGPAKPATAGVPPRSWPVIPLQPSVPPLIDTTEFRPSDARKGEFDRSPL